MVDFSQYERRRRGVNDDWAAKRAASDFGRFTSQQRGSQQLGDYRRDYKRGHQGFMGNQARRGTTGPDVQSGAFRQALGRRVGDFTRGEGRIQQGIDWNNQRYDQENANMDRWRRESLQDIEYDKQRQIALTAAGIAGVRPLIGG